MDCLQYDIILSTNQHRSHSGSNASKTEAAIRRSEGDTVHADRMLLRASFFLFLLALLNGMAIPKFLNPRLALSAHLTGLMNSFALTSLAVAWPLLHASPVHRKWIRWMFLFCAYMIWFTNVLGAAWGTNWLTPMAGKGFHAATWQQVIVAGMIMFTVMVYITAAALVVWALRPVEETDEVTETSDIRAEPIAERR